MNNVSEDYTISEPIAARSVIETEPGTRYFGVVRHKPAAADDPISWLVTIYRGEAVESYWRGSEDEAQDALTEYLQREGNEGV
jgi:hypothetical protein